MGVAVAAAIALVTYWDVRLPGGVDVEEITGKARKSVEEMAAGVGERVGELTDQARERAGELTGKARESIQEAASGVRDKVEEAAESEVRERAMEKLRKITKP